MKSRVRRHFIGTIKDRSARFTGIVKQKAVHSKNTATNGIKRLAGILKGVLILAALFIVVAALIAIQQHTGRQRAEYDFASRLTESINIDELYTSKLIYNGIVDVLHEDSQKIHYSMKYNSTVKVGIQVEDIAFVANISQKTVSIILPAISIQDPVIDASSIRFIPHNPDIDLKMAIAACREDARLEAEQNKNLIETAEENLKSIIEALTLPILKAEGYTIVWKSEGI